MNPTPNQQAERELRGLATQIEDYREVSNITQADLLAKYRELGTDRTFRRLVKGELEELNVEEQLIKYRLAWHQIEAARTVEASEPRYDDLDGISRFRLAFMRVSQDRGNARCLFLLGASGTGKTSCEEFVEDKYGAYVSSIEASEAWKSKAGDGTAGPMLRAIAHALGLPKPPQRRDGLLNTLSDALEIRRRAIIVREAGHLCSQGLDTIKTLINRTPTVFILSSLPHLWDRMMSDRDAYVAARQLTGNRHAGTIRLKLVPKDVETILSRRLGLEGKLLSDAVEKILPEARQHGNLAYVREVVKAQLRSGKTNAMKSLCDAMADAKGER